MSNVKKDQKPRNGKKAGGKSTNKPPRDHKWQSKREAGGTGAPEPAFSKGELIRSAMSGDKAAQRLLLSYLLPLSYPPERHADAYGSRPTAVAHPWDQLDAPWFNRGAPAAGYPSNFALDCLVMVLKHDPKEFLMYTNFACSRGQADLTAPESVYSWRQDGTALPTSRQCRPGDWYDFSIAVDNGGTLSRHGARIWPKRFGDRCAMLMDFIPTGSSYAATRLRLGNAVAFSASNTYMFTVRAFSRGGYRDIVYAQAGNGTAVMDVAISQVQAGAPGAYIALRYDGYYLTASGPAAVDSTILSLSVNAFQYCDGISVLELPGLDSNEDSVDELRILGQSLMYTNDAAPQFRAGKRAQYQASGADAADTFFYPVTRTIFSNIAENQGAVSEDIEEGAFSFRKPGGARDWDMIPLDGPKANPGSGQGQGSVQDTADYLVMAISAPIPSASNQTAQVGRITYGSGIEYETEDTWRTIEAPRMDPLYYQQVISRIRAIDQHHTNKFHVANIFKGVGRVLSALKRPAQVLLSNSTDPRARLVGQVLTAMP